ncbi:hypothetical protein BMS3Abin09_00343 [bacterium BMS3Abin09]|nr:hypothetical protein BMS3Abin09_00343 [bacterium BMS3Abin09]
MLDQFRVLFSMHLHDKHISIIQRLDCFCKVALGPVFLRRVTEIQGCIKHILLFLFVFLFCQNKGIVDQRLFFNVIYIIHNNFFLQRNNERTVIVFIIDSF